MFENKQNLKSKLLFPILDYIFFFRPLLILPIWAPLLLGYWAAGGRAAQPGASLPLDIGIYLAGWIYGLNQIYDIEGDRINKKNLPLSLDLISLKGAWIITIASGLMALIAAFSIGPWTGLLTLLGVAMGGLYSYPKFAYKDKPWHSLALNALGHGSLVYLIGWSIGGALDWMMLVRMLPYSLAYGGVYIATTIPDKTGDARTGKITLSVHLGYKRSAIVAIAAIAMGSITGLIFLEPALFLTGLFSFPFYLSAYRKGPEQFVRANKIAVLLLNLCICFYMFSFIPVLSAVILASMLYYRYRLGVKYP